MRDCLNCCGYMMLVIMSCSEFQYFIVGGKYFFLTVLFGVDGVEGFDGVMGIPVCVCMRACVRACVRVSFFTLACHRVYFFHYNFKGLPPQQLLSLQTSASRITSLFTGVCH